VQGYNAQAAVTENYIVIAAEITVRSPDFGHLERIVEAAEVRPTLTDGREEQGPDRIGPAECQCSCDG